MLHRGFMTTTPERHPLSLADVEDILAYIPHALGFHPVDSVVLLLVQEQRLEATLRVDLPAMQPEEGLNAWVLQVTNLLRRMPEVRSVVAVVYAPSGLGSCREIPYRAMHEKLRDRLQLRGIELRHAWCLGPRCIWDYHAESVEAWLPRPQTDGNETHLSMVLAGSAPLNKPWDGCGMEPWPNAENVRELADALRGNSVEGIARWAKLLELPPELAAREIHEDPTCAAELIDSLRWKVVRDILPYLAGTSHGETVDVLVKLSEREPGEEVPELGQFLLGQGWRSPDWERTERLWYLARDLLGIAQNHQRYALMCVLGWIEWAKGRGSLAMTLLDQVLRECPDYNLAKLLKEMLNQGIMPHWATDQLRAWRAHFA